MLKSYGAKAGQLVFGVDPPQAIWLDVTDPSSDQVAALQALGIEVPSLADLEEIEISNRLYRESSLEYMTVVVPSIGLGDTPVTGPVCFILGKDRLITVRYQRFRPFETYPTRADKTGPGCDAPDLIFLGLMEEITGRIADILEGCGKALDLVMKEVFTPGPGVDAPRALQSNLERTGLQSEIVAKVQLSLLTMERALAFFQGTATDYGHSDSHRAALAALLADLRSLSVHGDYLSNRVSQATEATLGMINLAQNAAVRSLSVVAVLFLPPTLIASIYGMNFRLMPELDQSWGYPMALGLMVLSAAVAWIVSKWKGWL